MFRVIGGKQIGIEQRVRNEARALCDEEIKDRHAEKFLLHTETAF